MASRDPGHAVVIAHGYGEHAGRYEHEVLADLTTFLDAVRSAPSGPAEVRS